MEGEGDAAARALATRIKPEDVVGAAQAFVEERRRNAALKPPAADTVIGAEPVGLAAEREKERHVSTGAATTSRRARRRTASRTTSRCGATPARSRPTRSRAKKNGLTNDQQMWRDSGALTANEIAREEERPHERPADVARLRRAH